MPATDPLHRRLGDAIRATTWPILSMAPAPSLQKWGLPTYAYPVFCFAFLTVPQVDVSGNICSRPESTINCVTRQSAFSDEITARHVAFVALALSVMFYAANLSNRMLFATKLLLAEQ